MTGLAWSPDSTKLAVAQSDNIVFVYKLGLEWTDKKSICNKFPQTSAVTACVWPSGHPNEVAFGLAEGKVRVGQLRTNKSATLFATDNGSAVMSLAASPDGHALLSGHVDGSVYRYVLSDAALGAAAGAGVGHAKFTHHPCPPAALSWGLHVCVAGGDGRVCFYRTDGALERTFDHSPGASASGAGVDWTTAAFNPSGEAVAVGSYDAFTLYTLTSSGEGGSSGAHSAAADAGSSSARDWKEALVRSVPGMYSVTALAWKPDGSKLAVGGLTGLCDLYDACLRRTRYRNAFEFTYVSPSTVVVRRLANGTRIVLRSSFGYEISRIRIHKDRFLTARTPATLLMGDLESCRLSEIPWHQAAAAAPAAPAAGGKGRGSSAAAAAAAAAARPAPPPERFLFDVWPTVCLVDRGSELTLVEYGTTEPLGVLRTEHATQRTLSVRITPAPGAPPGSSAVQKYVAYLLDANTVRVCDLAPGGSPSLSGPLTLATCSVPDSRIVWLELSSRGTLALLRDARRRLHLLNTATGARSTLLPYCSFASWVPGSDVAVAQRRGQLCVWYNIHSPDKVTVYDIRGDVEGVERSGRKTEVIVDEGLTSAAYQLDEVLISFGVHMDAQEYARAAEVLEDIGAGSSSSSSGGLSPEAEGMWMQVRKEAERAGDLSSAARAAQALGDAPRAYFLAKTAKAAGARASAPAPFIAARLAQLEGDAGGAEQAYLSAGALEEALQMYAGLGRGEDAVALAEAHGRGKEAEALRGAFTAFLAASGQEEGLGAQKEGAGDVAGAVTLFLKAGRPGRALTCALNGASGSGSGGALSQLPRDLLSSLITSLASAGMYDKAGSLLERCGEGEKALEAYRRGGAWRSAVDLCRRSFPGRVVELERAWGEWLVGAGSNEAAVNHFIEAGAHREAIEACLAARQFSKAGQLIEDTLSRAGGGGGSGWAPPAAAPGGCVRCAGVPGGGGARAHTRGGWARCRGDAAGRCQVGERSARGPRCAV